MNIDVTEFCAECSYIATRIFDRLVRLDGSRSRERGGFGLAIARALAGAHGGELACLPQPPGTGARFRLTLPSVPTNELIGDSVQ